MKLRSFKRRPFNGFALIATILLMVLLAIIAIGTLSLATVTLRSGSQDQAHLEAQANARMALMIAIGELQKHAGPDMRITAPADIVHPDLPPLTGVWRSWEGTNHETSGNFTGRPLAPDYASKDSRLVSWLVSGASSAVSSSQLSDLVSKTAQPNSVALVAEGSLAAGDDRQVHVPLLTLPDGGKYAWWVSPENQKARFPKPYNPKNDTVADWSAFASSHSVSDPGVFGLDTLLVDASPAEKTFTLATADIYTDANAAIRPGSSFHDLSTSSIGLLTNVATGGWRKDLSLLTERWNEQPSGNNQLQLFQLLPDQRLSYTRATAGNTVNNRTQVPNNMIYHWSDYAISAGTQEAHYNVGAIASWSHLASWASFYKQFTPTITTPSMAARGYTHTTNYYKTHDIGVVPKIARLEIIVSHFATPSTDPTKAGKLIPHVLYTPVITIWNPYNVAIVVNQNISTVFHESLPLVLKYDIAGVSYPKAAVQLSGVPQFAATDLSNIWMLNFTLVGGTYTLRPGETKVFSPGTNVRTTVNVGSDRVNMNLSPNYRNGVGFYFPLNRMFPSSPPMEVDASLNNVFASSTSIKVAEASLDSGRSGTICGAYGQTAVGGDQTWLDVRYEQAQANTLYPPITELIDAVTLDECRTPKPFLSFTFGMRSASTTLQAAKGFVQSNPLLTMMTPGTAGAQRHNMRYNYRGGKTLINCAWDYSFVPFSSGPGGTVLPDVGLTSDLGFIISGSRKSDGLSRCVIAEVPTRPISSLAELTHWDARHLNSLPPFAYNVFGNSDASPLLATDQVYVPYEPSRNTNAQYTAKKNLQHDDSYILNHIFFDDWFVSSIAPQPVGFGSGGGTFEDTYKAFVQGETQLANRAYKAIPEDVVENATDATTRYDNNVKPVDSWKTVASRLEVEGMFNVNSTSINAWRALLGHARNQKIPHLNPTANGVLLSDPTDYAFSKTNVAGAEKAGTLRSGEYMGTTEFTGYRVLDDAMLDKLAEEVVKQVRLRGPFLSLSEFVNRRLTNNASEQELALAGAIQAAMNALTDDSSLNPFADLQAESNPSIANPPGNPEYAFPQAAVGHSSYGLPGWTRQADVLRPLAPILSARDDTFTIRAYGESVDANGNTVARAWCEATVIRRKDFVDDSEKADITGQPQKDANKSFGRRFELMSFRWLNPAEV
jgi:type II secretory pathway pseudopilin PulG